MRHQKIVFLGLIITALLIVQINPFTVPSMQPIDIRKNQGSLNQENSNIGKIGKYDSATLYNVRLVNTTDVLNDNVSIGDTMQWFYVVNSTVFVNSTKSRKIVISFEWLGNVKIYNSTLKSLDNHTRYKMWINQHQSAFCISINRSRFENVQFEATSLYNAGILSLENVTFYDSEIWVLQAGYVYFKNCTFINSTVFLEDSYHLKILDSQFIDSYLEGSLVRNGTFTNLTFNNTKTSEDRDMISFLLMWNSTFSNNTIYGKRDTINIQYSLSAFVVDNNKLYNSSFKVFFNVPCNGTIFGSNNFVNDLPVLFYNNVSYVTLKDVKIGEIIAVWVDNLSLIDVTASGIFLQGTNNTYIENYIGRDGGLGLYLFFASNTEITQAQIEDVKSSLTITGGSNIEISQTTINNVNKGIVLDNTEKVKIEKTEVSDVLEEDGIYIYKSNDIRLNQITVYNVPGRDVTIESSESIELIDLDLYDGGFYPLVNSTAYETFTVNGIFLDNRPIEIHFKENTVNITTSNARQIIVFAASNVTMIDVSMNETNILLNTVANASINDSSIENAYYGVFMYSVNHLTINHTTFNGNLYSVFSYYNNTILNITNSEFTKNTYGFYAQNVECWLRDNMFASNSFAIYDTQTDVNGVAFLNSFIENTYDFLSKDPDSPSGILLSRLGIGNYWDKFEGVDTNGDMISESAYQLPVNNKDLAPFVEPPHYEEQISTYTILIVNWSWWFKAVERQIVVRPIYVLNTTLLENVIFHYNVSNTSAAVLMVRHTPTDLYTAYLSLYQNNTSFTYWLEFRYMNQTYYSRPREFTISVNTLNVSVPDILDVAFNSSIYTNESLVITANITDALDLISVQVRYNTTDGWLTKEMIFSESLNQYIVIFRNLNQGNFTFQIYVENMMGFSNTTGYYTVEVKEYETPDTQSPTIISVMWSPEIPFVNSTLTIFVTVTDNVGIRNVTAQITINGTTETYMLTKLGNETYFVTINTPQFAANISVIIEATDVNNNAVTSNTYYINIVNISSSQTNISTPPSAVNYLVIAIVSAIIGAAVSFVVVKYLKKQKNK